MRSQSRCSRPRVLATEGFPDPCSPRANPLARHHHGHRPHLRQVRRHGEPSEEPGTRAAGSRQPEWHEAGGRGQEAEGGGQRKPGTGGGIGDAPRPALAPGPHNPPRCCRSTTGCTSLRGGRGSRGGVGIGGGWQGSRIKLAGLHNTLKPPLRLAGADAFPDRRRARPAARQQVRISRGGCGGRQPPAIRAAPQAKFWKIAKKCQRKFSFFGRFCHRKTRPPDQPGPDFRKKSARKGPANFQVLQ